MEALTTNRANPRGRGLRPRDHQVVEDAAVVGKKLRIALLIGFQAHDIRRNERFERPCDRFVALVLGDQESLAHVGNIEQARMLAGPVVLGHDAGGVLDRHVIAGERHHARAKGNMLGMKGGLQRLVGVDRLGHGISSKARVRRAFQGPFFTPPLSHDLRDFPNATSERLRPSVGDVAKRRRFPECQLPAVLLPERFRGGCAFGAGLEARSLPRGSAADQPLARIAGPVNEARGRKRFPLHN